MPEDSETREGETPQSKKEDNPSPEPVAVGAEVGEIDRSCPEEGKQPNEVRQASKRRATGPRTATGKAISSRNATKLAFFSKYWPIRSPFFPRYGKRFKHLLKALTEDWKPVGALEVIQVELAAFFLDRFFRVLEVSEALVLKDLLPQPPDLKSITQECAREAKAGEKASQQPQMPERTKLFDLYESIPEPYRVKIHLAAGLTRAIREECERLEGLSKGRLPRDTEEWLQTCADYNLRNYYRACKEMERLKRMRLGDSPPPRLLIDVDSN
jgi:hypothetical protein